MTSCFSLAAFEIFVLSKSLSSESSRWALLGTFYVYFILFL